MSHLRRIHDIGSSHILQTKSDIIGHRVKSSQSPEDNAFDVNLIAAQEIARQLRLRDMGGIITIDLTLFDMKTEREVDMGGTFDWFGLESYPDYPNLSKDQIAKRQLLRDAMMKAGFKPFETEWWHFTLENEPFPDTYFDFPVR